MQIRCDANFDVFQDGVKWSPVGIEGGAVEYVLNSNGRISISVAGREVFFFTVDFVPDFVYDSTSYGAFQNAELETIFTQRFGSGYFQAPFVNGTDRLSVYVGGVNADEVLALDRYVSRGTLQAFATSDGRVLFQITDIGSLSEPLWLKVGNVLIAFCEPKI